MNTKRHKIIFNPFQILVGRLELVPLWCGSRRPSRLSPLLVIVLGSTSLLSIWIVLKKGQYLELPYLRETFCKPLPNPYWTAAVLKKIFLSWEHHPMQNFERNLLHLTVLLYEAPLSRYGPFCVEKRSKWTNFDTFFCTIIWKLNTWCKMPKSQYVM
jgi:hypothetical protein